MDMKARINIDLVAFAVGRAITCKGCGSVLDNMMKFEKVVIRSRRD